MFRIRSPYSTNICVRKHVCLYLGLCVFYALCRYVFTKNCTFMFVCVVCGAVYNVRENKSFYCNFSVIHISFTRMQIDSEVLDCPADSAFRRVIAKVKQRWSVIGWVTKNLLSWAPPCFGRHVMSLVSAAFAVVSSHQPALSPRGRLWPVLLMRNPRGRSVPQQWGH
jgi:hypothetical protein